MNWLTGNKNNNFPTKIQSHSTNPNEGNSQLKSANFRIAWATIIFSQLIFLDPAVADTIKLFS
jgi:hypothetical protein